MKCLRASLLRLRGAAYLALGLPRARSTRRRASGRRGFIAGHEPEIARRLRHLASCGTVGSLHQIGGPVLLSKRFGAIPARHLARGAFTLLVTAGAWGCAREEQGPTAPNGKINGGSVVSPQQPYLDSALAVHRRHTMRLIAIPGVVGTAVGLTPARQPAIRIYTKTARVAGLPDNLEGIPVELQETGEVFAQPA